MRLPLLPIVAALVLAGCATNETPPTGTTTPTVTAPTTGTGTGTPIELAKDEHDFTGGGTPASQPTSTPFTIPATVSTLNLTVRFSPIGVGPGGVALGVTVTAGGLTCTLPDGPVTSVVGCTKEGPATAGDAQVQYSGSGPVTADVTVTAT